MYANASTAPLPDEAAAVHAAPAAEEADAARPPMLDSEELLRGGRTVIIRHNGAFYRLQATKLGKLILTK
ncbi:MAG: hemin uptake protein HemP [Burkholderiales bacterium]|jgi:hemin uptake protein HemP|nr:hemin uptake protein HemP [Burkholderiales bacterium]